MYVKMPLVSTSSTSTSHPHSHRLFFLVVSIFLIGLFVDGVQGEAGELRNGTNSSSDHPSSSVTNGHTEGNNHTNDGKPHETHEAAHGSEPIEVASLKYHEIRDPLIFTIVILVVSISKIGYHHADFLSSRVPESCILILFGIVFGAIIYFSGSASSLPQFFRPHEFFIYLLPPIILESSYSLYNRTFVENLGSILLFAVVGSILACSFMGLSLYGLAQIGAMGDIAHMSFVEVMVFASLIVAVDPVAVLAVLNEIGVNHVLYFLVFGESLLNDGVTVVLYKVFQSYNVMEEINGYHIFLGFVKFFVVCFGGLALGIIAGLVTALLTRTTQHVKVAQPMIIYTVAYLGFLMAELFEFSGIISIVGCGLTQRHYAFQNISDKSTITLKYFTKVISTMCEIVIFLFLGLSMVNDKHIFHVGFTLWTIVLCLVFRFIIIFGMTFLINWLDLMRVRKIGLHEQFMIAYGGLRGAVCFSLVELLNPVEFPQKEMFVTTTLAVIMFTVFVQGITIKPLVFLLQITLAPEKNASMYVELNSTVTDHLMAGLEDIIGDHGKNHLREKMAHFDKEYLQPIFTIEPDPAAMQLKEFYEHLTLKEHLKYLKLSGATEMQNMPELPHVTTELFLSTLGHQKGSSPMIKESLTEEAPPMSPTTPPQIIIEPEVQLRNRWNRRSMSYSPGETNIVSSKGLRGLLLSSSRNSRLALTGMDRNLTKHNDMGSEIRRKSHQNRRLQRMFSSDDDTNATTDAANRKRLSWSESEAEVCRTRGDFNKGSKPPPRHCATVDLGYGYPPQNLEPQGRPGSDMMSSPLPSVFEEENEHAMEMEPLFPERAEDVDEDPGLNRNRRQSSKNKLKRQGGLDKPISTSSPTDESKLEGSPDKKDKDGDDDIYIA